MNLSLNRKKKSRSNHCFDTLIQFFPTLYPLFAVSRVQTQQFKIRLSATRHWNDSSKSMHEQKIGIEIW